MNIDPEKLNRIREWWDKYGPNKYILLTIAFVLVLLFAGDQSIINRIRKAHQIAELKEERDTYERGIEEAKRDIERLQNPDSLERYAREHYLMHAPNEDVYIVDE